MHCFFVVWTRLLWLFFWYNCSVFHFLALARFLDRKHLEGTAELGQLRLQRRRGKPWRQQVSSSRWFHFLHLQPRLFCSMSLVPVLQMFVVTWQLWQSIYLLTHIGYSFVGSFVTAHLAWAAYVCMQPWSLKPPLYWQVWEGLLTPTFSFFYQLPPAYGGL